MQIDDDGNSFYAKVQMAQLDRRWSGTKGGRLVLIGGLETIELTRLQAQMIDRWFSVTATGNHGDLDHRDDGVGGAE